MENFIIKAEESRLITREGKMNLCLQYDTEAFYHSTYQGGGKWKIDGTIENLICTLKNDRTPYTKTVLDLAVGKLSEILKEDLPKVLCETGLKTMRVCVVPRSKHEEYYAENQKLFRQTIQNSINNLSGFEDGTHDIIRKIDTRTTHSNISGNGGNGDMPYCGITRETCDISSHVNGKNILLIDDLYTKTVGIDEDAIQALYDNGACKVFFYSIGKTVLRFRFQ